MADGASGSGLKDDGDLEKLMNQLGICDDDLDDVVFEEEGPGLRWLGFIPRLEYSQTWFFANMRSAWGLAQGVKFRAIESNLYVLQFFCVGAWEKVMEGGPWNFRNLLVCIEPYDGFTKPSLIKLNSIPVWIQIHDLSEAFGRWRVTW
ncbi:hypothetical protein ACQ4PT_039258 [Festuca glaucescens]